MPRPRPCPTPAPPRRRRPPISDGPTPYGFVHRGRRYVAADDDAAVCVHLVYAYDHDRDPYANAPDPYATPNAHAVLIDPCRGVAATFAHAATGTHEIDADTGHPEPVYEWRVDDPDNGDVDPDTYARLDAALANVDDAWERWQMADSRMGDPYP